MKNIILLTISLIFLPFALSAQQMGPQTVEQLEESPAGNKILKFVSAINADIPPSEVLAREILAPSLIEKLSMDKLLGFMNQIKENEGGLQLYEVNRKEMLYFQAKAKGSSSGNWMDIEFHFEDLHPYKINGYSVELTDEAAKAPKPIFPVNSG